jgi:uncharacterized protein (DUF433 family)
MFRQIGTFIQILMAAPIELLKTTEAAVVAGVELREVNRAIDEGILPKDFFSLDNGRHVLPAGCILIAFYVGSAERLTAKERRFAIRTVGDRLRNLFRGATATSLKEDWTLKHEFLSVDFAPFVKSVSDRLRKLAAAEELISSSSEVLGGTPVIKGTRIPVHDVAASVEAGLSTERILAAYPNLSSDKIDLSVLYAKANPVKGRPRAAFPRGAVILADRRSSRRRKAG